MELPDAITLRRGSFRENDDGHARGEGRAHPFAHLRHRARAGAIQEQGADGFSQGSEHRPLREVVLRDEDRGA
jgi:hypothetical protein